MFTLLILLLCLISKVVSGKSYGFVFPNSTSSEDSNLVFVLGESIDIKWSSPFKAIKLAFIAEDGPVFQFFSQNNTGNDYTWAVNVNNSDSTSPYYYLYFENEDDNSQHYYSALFRVDSSPVNAQTTTPTQQATVTVTPSPTIQASASTDGATTIFVTRPISSSPSASSSSSNQPASSASSNIAAGASSTNSGLPSGSIVPVNNGLSQGAKIGIGVGVPLGVIALVGIGFFAVWRSWRHSRAAKANAAGVSDPGLGGYGRDNVGIENNRGQPTAYGQHSSKLANNQHAYSPVQQQIPMAESGGLHELPSQGANAGPHEMDGSATGFRGYR